MTHIEEDLTSRIKSLEKELQSALEDKARVFRYQVKTGKARFEDDVIAEQRKFKQRLSSYIRNARLLVVLSAPAIYLGIIPFCLLDLFLAFYQVTCFPVYGIPKVRRADYIVFDRGSLKYLNLLERLNCAYCSYANGLLAYGTEVAARTEHHGARSSMLASSGLLIHATLVSSITAMPDNTAGKLKPCATTSWTCGASLRLGLIRTDFSVHPRSPYQISAVRLTRVELTAEIDTSPPESI